jgi:iron(III) transport system ATP-binding protein
MSAALVEITAATKRFNGRSAVDSVSLTAPAGGVLALLGASGSGKSTLLRLIAGLETLDAGQITLGSQRLSAPGFTVPPERRRIGLVFQDFALFPHLTAAQNVAFGLDQKDKSAALRQASLWLDEVGLGHRASAFPHELSGGEQQRVALARALAPRPLAVLLDEPFSGLDPTLRTELREFALNALKAANTTAIFVTHDADEALYVADQLAILTAGRLEQAGPPREVYARPTSRAAAQALGPVNIWQGMVRQNQLQTPFGAVQAPTNLDATPATAVVRAEALRISPGEGATVTARRPQGAADLIRISAGDTIWRGQIDPTATLSPGQSCAVAIDPAGAFVFKD